jgi:hypothetical protein
MNLLREAIMEYHEYANLFPLMSVGELKELCDDMQVNGYDKTAPITLFDGKILDGRNRQRAADNVGVDPNYITFNGSEPDALSYVIRHNLKRRHLNESQRAMIGARIADMRQGTRTDIMPIGIMSTAQPKAAELMNVSVHNTEANDGRPVSHSTPSAAFLMALAILCNISSRMGQINSPSWPSPKLSIGKVAIASYATLQASSKSGCRRF